jgi:hypothetical protein
MLVLIAEPTPSAEHNLLMASFPYRILYLFLVYVSILHFYYKLVRGNALFQNSAEILLTYLSVCLFYSELYIEHFDMDMKFSNMDAMLGHHSLVANVDKIHYERTDSFMLHSDDAMAT